MICPILQVIDSFDIAIEACELAANLEMEKEDLDLIVTREDEYLGYVHSHVYLHRRNLNILEIIDGMREIVNQKHLWATKNYAINLMAGAIKHINQGWKP
jgi:hypothetical protein